MFTVEQLLTQAREIGASDIHLTAGAPPLARVDGELEKLDYPKLMSDELERIVFSFMSERQAKLYREKGEVQFSVSFGNSARYRVNVFRQRGCDACSIRIIETELRTAEQLGIPVSAASLCSRKSGLVLAAGGAGSGRSATLAAFTDMINNERNVHIVTLEKPIEYIHTHKRAVVNQREIGTDTASYSEAVRAALKEDTDVIVADELDSADTVCAVLSAVRSGCLVFAAVNAQGAAEAVWNIVSLFPSERQRQIREELFRALEAVLAQRLIPREGGGGRAAAFEVMYATRKVRELIREGDIDKLEEEIKNGGKDGMVSMDDAVAELFRKGEISEENALSYANSASYVSGRIKKID